MAALAPAAPVELAERGDEHLRAVGPLAPVLVAADRQLPADVRLVFQRVHAVTEGLAVQRAAGAAGEARVVEEDAGAVGTRGGAPGRRLAVDGVQLGVVLEAAPVVLPGLRG